MLSPALPSADATSPSAPGPSRAPRRRRPGPPPVWQIALLLASILPCSPARPRRSATAAHRRRVDWLLETTLRQCRLWRDQDVRLGVAVNFSMRTLRDRQVPAAAADLPRWLAVQPTDLLVAG